MYYSFNGSVLSNSHPTRFYQGIYGGLGELEHVRRPRLSKLPLDISKIFDFLNIDWV